MIDIGLLPDLLLLAGLAIPIVALAHRIKAPPLLGFVLSGVLVGPAGLGLIAVPDSIKTLMELGVALLLFAVGLELSPAKVRHWARMILVGGSIQVLGTIGAFFLGALALGVPVPSALFYGALASMSSTAIVSRSFADRGELDAPVGRASIALLVYQDFAVLPLVLALPLLGGFEGAAAGAAVRELGRGLFIIAALVLGGRVVAPWALGRIALLRDRELFTLCIAFLAFGAAFVSFRAGFSLAIGAFIAGLILSGSRYGAQALSDVLPFRALFSAVFFASVGMLLEPDALLAQPLVVLGIVAAALVAKSLLAAAGVLAGGARLPTAAPVGLGLAHVGEFAFLLAAVGLPLGLFLGDHYQLFLGVAVLSMAVAPLLIHVGPAVSARLRRDAPDPEDERTGGLADHTIVVGYGLAGRYLARALKAAGVGVVVVDENLSLVRQARADEVTALYGDGAGEGLLRRAGIANARAVVFAINSLEAERRGAAAARDLNPEVRVLVRTRFVRAIDELLALGATHVVVEEFEASVELFARALESYGAPPTRIWRRLESLRAEHYGLFRDREHAGLRLDRLKQLGFHEALDLIEVEAAFGESAASLDLRKATGVIQVALIRDQRPIREGQAEARYRKGDTLVLLGDPDSLDRARNLFAPG